MPKIGAGLGGLDLGDVKEAIINVFEGSSLRIMCLKICRTIVKPECIKAKSHALHGFILLL